MLKWYIPINLKPVKNLIPLLKTACNLIFFYSCPFLLWEIPPHLHILSSLKKIKIGKVANLNRKIVLIYRRDIRTWAGKTSLHFKLPILIKLYRAINSYG
jgi:hypothetical protein